MLINISYKSHQDWDPQKLETALQKYGYVLDYIVKRDVEALSDAGVDEFVEHYFSMVAAVADSCANEPTPFAVMIEDLPLYVACRLANVLHSSGFEVVTPKYVKVMYEGKELREFAEFVKLIK
jgi:hypothetical protein